MSEEARNSICPECGSYRVTYEHTDNYDWQLCTCECCGCSGTPDEFFHNSVFARITASVEVLAPNFVYFDYSVCDDNGMGYPWCSTLFEDGGHFETEEKAIAATIEKLKEVNDVRLEA